MFISWPLQSTDALHCLMCALLISIIDTSYQYVPMFVAIIDTVIGSNRHCGTIVLHNICACEHSHLRGNVLVGGRQHDGHKLIQELLIGGYL